MIKLNLTVGDLGTNCYVIADENTRKAAVIDPGDEAGRIISAVEDNGLELSMILITHAHHDHTGALDRLYQRFNVPVYMHPADRGGPPQLFYSGDVPTQDISDGDTLSLGDISIKVLNTPGHSMGSCVFLAEDNMFSGDTLFAGSCGRVDFYGGDASMMMESLKRLAALPGDYGVYPGHMGFSTLERERKTNYYMRELSL